MMKNEPLQNRWRELLWRQKPTDAGQAELHAHLAAHPDVRADWETESALTDALTRLPDANVPSNFTARVLQAVELEDARDARRRGWHWTWHVLVPRLAIAAVVVGFAGLVYQRYEFANRAALAQSLTLLTAGQPLPSAEALKDFDAIQRLSRTTTRADDELLALLQ
jgi:negative regulator of sigma E activity